MSTSKGILACASFAFAPNRLSYCGPDKTSDLKGYIRFRINDQGLVNILSRFETLHPYLQLISQANGWSDPFDIRAVEAYWIGNSLLSKVSGRTYYEFLKNNPRFSGLAGKAHDLPGQLPSHNFHVFNIFGAVSRRNFPDYLETADSCRISWGKIIKKLDLGISSGFRRYKISSSRLVLSKDRILLDKPREITVESVRNEYMIGDTVSVHWGIICSKLNRYQLMNLKIHTLTALQYSNRVILREL